MSMGPKQAILAEFAGVARALGHAHRLELLEHLGQGERGVDALATRVGLSLANASQHLQQLRRAGLVANRREGKFIYYRLADDGVTDLLTALRHQAERNLAEVDRIRRGYFADRDSFEPVSREELLERVGAGLVTVLDVRPQDEFGQGHLTGAVNIPLGELQNRLAELDPDREVIAYCRGAYCVFAFEAVAVLRAQGRNARRLVDGFPEWKAAGLPFSIMGGLRPEEVK
ncbi:MAG: ArsR family transcriptional regulator [Rhodobacterales bacterium 12-64-8]|nr:MAG: ArsR family transcriptional regulator [Rhodobacterales bacterium 12-64-8]